MKPHERRTTSSYPYFKLAAWCPRSFAWKAGREAFATEETARASAVKAGRYRLTRVTASGYEELEPFEVG